VTYLTGVISLSWRKAQRSTATAKRNELAGEVGLLRNEQTLYDLPSNEMALDDLDDIVHGDLAVPDLFRINDEGDAVLALVEAAGVVGPNALAKASRGQLLLELVSYLHPVFGVATATRMPSSALVGANEDVSFESRHL
jgi:hypothetical protein